MKLIDFIKNVDFATEYISINIGEDNILKTDFVAMDNRQNVEVLTNIDGFISILQGESVISFRPEAVTHFYKNRKYNSNAKS